jgi:hypothetical protein
VGKEGEVRRRRRRRRRIEAVLASNLEDCFKGGEGVEE